MINKEEIYKHLDAIADLLEGGIPEKDANESKIPQDNAVPPATLKQIALMKDLKIEFDSGINKLEASKLITNKIGDRPFKNKK